jgi:Tfp pilus assembly protein FimV
MKKIHVTTIALLLALAAVLGTFAATRTASLGTASRHAGDAAYRAHVKQLDAFSAKLRHELAAKPAPVQYKAAAAAAAAPRIVYHRPPPIVVVKHTHHGDDGSESTGGGGRDD